MKTMPCKQLGGACDVEFKADSFDDMAELRKAHAMEKWLAQRRAEFDALPDDSAAYAALRRISLPYVCHTLAIRKPYTLHTVIFRINR